jgi:hypothetical protein
VLEVEGQHRKDAPLSPELLPFPSGAVELGVEVGRGSLPRAKRTLQQGLSDALRQHMQRAPSKEDSEEQQREEHNA